MSIQAEQHAALLQSVQERVHRLPGALRQLNSRSNLRALLGITLDWLIIIASAIVSERLDRWWVYLLSVFVIATRINAFCLEWQHEAIHCNLFTRKSWHERLDFLYALPFLASVKLSREVHLQHHRVYGQEFTEALGGYEYWEFSASKWQRPAYRVWIWLLRPLLGYHVYTNLRDTIWDLYLHPRELLRCLIFFVPLLGLFAAYGKLNLLGWYWLVPYFVVHPVLFFWQDLAQHFNTRRSATRDVRGAIYQFIFSPHGRGAHHNLHHLYPGIPWFNIRRASALLVDDRLIDTVDGFLGLTRQVLRPLFGK